MKKIKIEDLKKYSKNILEESVEIIIGEMEVGVRQHTTIIDKLDFVANTYNSSIENEEGKHIINGALYDVAYKIGLISRYTNLTLPKDGIEAYSLITDTGIYDLVLKAIPDIEKKELDRITQRYLDDKEKEYNQINSSSMTIKNVVEAIANMIPDMDNMTKILANAENFTKELADEDTSFKEHVKEDE